MNDPITHNLHVLEQGVALLHRLDDARYMHCLPGMSGSSIGAHIRHNLDHYACFLHGLDTGCIDYAARPRDVRIERDRGAALAGFARIGGALSGLTLHEHPVLVKGEAGPHSAGAASSMARELEFLLSHSIHHYAIVAILCRQQGVGVDAGFGVAPSTLRHRAGKQSS